MTENLRPTVDRALKVAFVGSAISEELFHQTNACSSAGNKYQLGLLRGFEAVVLQPLYVISTQPVAMYPHSHVVLSRTGTSRVSDLTVAKLIPFLNVPVLKQATILLSVFKHLTGWLWQTRKSKKCVVIVFNVFSPFSLSVLAATALFGGTPVAIVADLPHDVYDFKGNWRGLLQRIDFYIQTHSIRRFAAVIPLTRQIAEDFALGLPVLVIEGGVDIGMVENMDTVSTHSRSTVTTHEKVIFYSGSINDINGVDLLIQAFQLLSDPLYRLHIFGQGPMLPMVREAMDQDKRIHYGGVLSNPEIMRRQTQATVLVNPRPSHRKITRYTFPSKVLEYMVSGRPTITTVLPGIPEDYYPYLYLLRDETPNGLAQLIEDVCSEGAVELEQRGQLARDFVLQNKNWICQGERIYEFVSKLR